MSKRFSLLILLLLALLGLTACSQQPPAGLLSEQNEAPVIAAEPEVGSDSRFTATLYFRWGDTALLRQETREISVSPNETREKALVNALLAGAREGGSRPLFPEKTEVLSTQAQDGVIYVTFNEALYDRYAEDGKDAAARTLRRELAMAALTATLTESGEYGAVQVLVRAQENVGQSMRLRLSFFGNGEEGIAPPLTRRQQYLPTPGNYADALLRAWQQRDWSALSVFVSLRSGLSSAQLSEALNASAVLLDYTVYEGTVAPDGESAVVCADLTLRNPDGDMHNVGSQPLRLIREGGAWKIAADRLLSVMGENDE